MLHACPALSTSPLLALPPARPHTPTPLKQQDPYRAGGAGQGDGAPALGTLPREGRLERGGGMGTQQQDPSSCLGV